MNQSAAARCTAANGCQIVDNCKAAKNAYSFGYCSGLFADALCSVDWALPPQ